ncbi:MAG: ferric reductase-like transmembrane domain-containing protein [Acidimicrobiia bacterium]|nr:ferric reductase-like transmembrane domain-containing protein [Acidimicrobiia bacterium]
MTEQVWWYVARASGIVASALVAAAVIWGLLLSTRVLRDRPRPAWLLDLHRMLGGLAVAFVVVHVASLAADSYVEFGPVDVLVPFVSDWRPGPVAFGVLATYLLMAAEVSSLMMRRLPRRWWHRVHLSSYVCFWAVTMHGATAGTDVANPLFRWGSITAIAVVVVLSVYRVAVERRSRRKRPVPAAA